MKKTIIISLAIVLFQPAMGQNYSREADSLKDQGVMYAGNTERRKSMQNGGPNSCSKQLVLCYCRLCGLGYSRLG